MEYSPNPLVFDVSSDEEPAATLFGEEDPPELSEENNYWLREIFQDVDQEKQTQYCHVEEEEKYDSDEVVILGECYNPTKPKPKPKSPGSKPGCDIDDDDDCVVLEGDPDGPVDVVGDLGGGGDDLLVVGQKGQVACRDYPHSRHLCIKYPFNLMPHERYCELCHCYVCDVPAPCLHWGSGVSSVDHCHATDKKELWISMRTNFRLGKNVPTLVAHSVIPAALTQFNQIGPPSDVWRSIPQNVVSKPVTISNIVTQHRNQELHFVQGRNGSVPHKVSQQVFGVHSNNIVHRSRVPAANNSGRQSSSSSNAMFKRPGIVGRAFASSQSPYGLSYNRSCAPLLRCARRSVPSASQSDKNPGGKLDALPNVVSDSFRSSTPSVVGVNFFESELPAVPVHQSNLSANLVGNEFQNFPDPVLPDSDFNWLLCESNQHMPGENIHLHSTGTNNEPPVAKQLNPQISESNLDNWISLQPFPNALSSNPPAVDASMLFFDFETSWSGLHA